MEQGGTTTPAMDWPGWGAFALGVAALVLAMVHLWAGPFAPQQSVGVTIGEIAAEIWTSGQSAMAGEAPPAPEALAWDIDRVLEVAKPVLAGLALALATAALILRRGARAGLAGILFGASAVLFQFFAWAVLVVAGAILLAAIVANLGEILGV